MEGPIWQEHVHTVVPLMTAVASGAEEGRDVRVSEGKNQSLASRLASNIGSHPAAAFTVLQETKS